MALTNNSAGPPHDQDDAEVGKRKKGQNQWTTKRAMSMFGVTFTNLKRKKSDPKKN